MRALKITAVLLAATAVGALFASSALAATPEKTIKASWIEENGTRYPENTKEPTKCKIAGVEVEKSKNFQLKGTIAGAVAWLTATGVECVSAGIENVTAKNPTVVGEPEEHMAVGSGRIRFTGVTVMQPGAGACKVKGGTIETVNLNIDLKMHGEATAPKTSFEEFRPTTGTKLATIEIEGCGAAGSYPLTIAENKDGKGVFGLVNLTGEAKSEQPLEFNAFTAEMSSLELAGKAAELFGYAYNERSNGEKFSWEEK
jgi:hypothetical protein